MKQARRITRSDPAFDDVMVPSPVVLLTGARFVIDFGPRAHRSSAPTPALQLNLDLDFGPKSLHRAALYWPTERAPQKRHGQKDARRPMASLASGAQSAMGTPRELRHTKKSGVTTL